VKTGDDIDKISVQTVVDGIREATKENSAKPYSDFWKGFRKIRD